MSCTMKDNVCPKCSSEDVEDTTFAFDGINMNQSYKCNDCKHEWEGS